MHTWAWLLEATGSAGRLICGDEAPLITKDSCVCDLLGELTGSSRATGAMRAGCSSTELLPILSMACTQHNTTSSSETSCTQLDVFKHWLSCTRLHKERVRPLEMQQRLLHWHLCIKTIMRLKSKPCAIRVLQEKSVQMPWQQ